jgi:hypothetical protein
MLDEHANHFEVAEVGGDVERGRPEVEGHEDELSLLHARCDDEIGLRFRILRVDVCTRLFVNSSLLFKKFSGRVSNNPHLVTLLFRTVSLQNMSLLPSSLGKSDFPIGLLSIDDRK